VVDVYSLNRAGGADSRAYRLEIDGAKVRLFGDKGLIKEIDASRELQRLAIDGSELVLDVSRFSASQEPLNAVAELIRQAASRPASGPEQLREGASQRAHGNRRSGSSGKRARESQFKTRPRGAFFRTHHHAASLLLGSLVGGLLSVVGLHDSPPTMQVIWIGMGATMGLVAALILLGIDRLKRPKSARKLPVEVPEVAAEGWEMPAEVQEMPVGTIGAEEFEAYRAIAPAEPPPADGVDVAIEASEVWETRRNPFEASVVKELEKARNPRGNWIQTLLILAVSLLVFVALGATQSPLVFTMMLVGVLFLHEIGHYLGMRIFGYRNVRMFFIPLFGAAVSGQKTSVKGYQDAIVSLMGPLPGLCLAAALFVTLSIPGLVEGHRAELAQAATLLALINGFNLLPVLPLDGGRLLNQILFSRNRYLEGAFLFVTVLALIAYGAMVGGPSAVGFGIGFLIMFGGNIYKTNAIVWQMRDRFRGQIPPIDAPIPPPMLRTIMGHVRRLSVVENAKTMAGATFRVWERMHIQTPGIAATMAILTVYLLAVGAAISLARSPFYGNSIQLQLEKAAADANKRLPMRIDMITQCERVAAEPGKTLSYIYTLTTAVTETQQNLFRTAATRRALAAPELQAILAAGVTLRFKYFDSSGKLIFEFPVKKGSSGSPIGRMEP
jgi:Zn-dependent protease